MPEFEEDPDGFKLRGFPVHEGTEDHEDATEEYNSSLPFMDMVQQGMEMFQQGKEVVGAAKDMFSGTPKPDEMGKKGIGVDGV
tara:strand:+ start:100 stop:348 length:249 start_codon:yes stop_codon:yes gene_type:complete